MKKSFHDEYDLDDYLENKYEMRLEIDFNKDDSDLTLIETEKSLIISFISPDNSSQNFFEEDDAGTFLEFTTPEQRQKYMSALAKTKKLYYLVDKYEHGSVHYSVAETHSYPDRQFDVTPGKAVFIPSTYIQSEYRKYKKEHGEVEAFKHFVKDSNSTLESYSQWCNGEVYGYQILIFDKEGNNNYEDSSWGYIGKDDIEKNLDNLLASLVLDEKVEEIAKEVDIDSLEANGIKQLPFKMIKKGFLSAKIAHVYDDIIVAAKYEDNSVVYNWNPSMEKATMTKFEEWQKNHNVTPEKFLEKRMQSDINTAIKNHLSKNDAKNKELTI